MEQSFDIASLVDTFPSTLSVLSTRGISSAFVPKYFTVFPSSAREQSSFSFSAAVLFFFQVLGTEPASGHVLLRTLVRVGTVKAR